MNPYQRQFVGAVATDLTLVGQGLQRRAFRSTLVYGEDAAGVEVTAAGWIGRVGYFALEGFAHLALPWIGFGQRGQ